MKDHLALQAGHSAYPRVMVPPVGVHSQVRPAVMRLAAFPAAASTEAEAALVVSTAVVLEVAATGVEAVVDN